MARLVGAFACSHGPLLSTPPENWYERADADKSNPKHAFRGAYYDFPALLAARQGRFAGELSIEKKADRYRACQTALDELARRFAACNADLAIILGNDQRELFRDEFMPAYLVYAGAEIANIYPDAEDQRRLASIGALSSRHGYVPLEGAVYRGAPEAAQRIASGLIDRGFDIALSEKLPRPNGRDFGIPHAFGFIFRRVMRDAPPPTVPIFSNVGEGLNQPRLRRMLAFGHALPEIIASLPDDLNVAVIASGGLSHFTIDEEFDQQVIAAMRTGDEERLASFPEPYFWGNTCETKSWYPMIAAMNDYGRRMDLIDYVPCYRTEAGTGQAMAFASWERSVAS
jgi:hypothetical protein